MKTILLKFSGPLQSWGTSSHFETRNTDYYPSKSGVIGLIAASLGLDRNDSEIIKSLNELDFIVRIDQKGSILKDYHTAKKYKKNGEFDRTYVTNRFYLEDAIFLVGISHSDENLMSTIFEALKQPYFQPFMGRRSNPIPLDFIVGITNSPIVESIESTPWLANDLYKRLNQETRVNVEIFGDSHLFNSSKGVKRKDRVISFSQKNRQFGFRFESRKVISIPTGYFEKDSEHNIFEAIGE